MSKSKLGVQKIKIESIQFNKDNPREIFSQEEEDKLYFSVKDRGVLVPVLLVQDGDFYILIDGERRLRAAKRAGYIDIPANVIEKGTSLEYAIKMFHIHNMRIGWRLMATALEIEKFKEAAKLNKEKDIAAWTGLSLSNIRNCNKLLFYPDKIREIILEQEALPRSEKKRIGKDKILSDNFFIELHSGLSILKRFEPKIFQEYGFERLINIFINKRKKGMLDNVTLFREFKKIVRLQNDKSQGIIQKILVKDDYTIEQGYADSGLQTEFLENKFFQQSSLFLENLERLTHNKKNIRIEKILKKIKEKIGYILSEK
jgi:ParB/RepB/Spo0J family partition protein